MKKVRKAVFPVGGLGTRFLPATKSLPKEMLPVVDKPLIQYAFEEACAAGIEQFLFITGRNKNAISNHFDNAFELQKTLSEKQKAHQLSLIRDWLPEAGQIAFIRQQEPLGLGHAVWCARNFINDEPFAVILADEMLLSPKPFLKEMVEAAEKEEANIIAIAEVPKDKTDQYGIVEIGSKKGNLQKIKSMVEKPSPAKAPSNLSIVGRYVLQPDIIEELGKRLHIKGSGGEVQLTDTMASMLEKHDFYGIGYQGKRFDCGNKEGFLEANIAFALQHKEMKDDVKKLIKKFAAEI